MQASSWPLNFCGLPLKCYDASCPEKTCADENCEFQYCQEYVCCDVDHNLSNNGGVVDRPLDDCEPCRFASRCTSDAQCPGTYQNQILYNPPSTQNMNNYPVVLDCSRNYNQNVVVFSSNCTKSYGMAENGEHQPYYHSSNCLPDNTHHQAQLALMNTPRRSDNSIYASSDTSRVYSTASSADNNNNGYNYPSLMEDVITPSPLNCAYPELNCQWNDCNTYFESYQEFQDHVYNSHVINTNNDYHCHWNACALEADDFSDLLTHIFTNHSKNHIELQCKWLIIPDDPNTPCNLLFDTPEELNTHVMKEHVGLRKPSYTCYWEDCDRCQRPFSQKQKIARHVQIHTNYKPFVCDICGHAFSEEYMLKQHKRRHSGEKPFQCKFCDKKFSASTALSVHMRTHTGMRPLICKYPGCNKTFPESSNLTKHMKSHMKSHIKYSSYNTEKV